MLGDPMIPRSWLVLGGLAAIAPGCSSDGGAATDSTGNDASASGGAANGATAGASAAGGTQAGGSGAASKGGTGGASKGGAGGASKGGALNGTGGASGSSPTDSGGAPEPEDGGTDAPAGHVPSGPFFSPYKDTGINMNWNTNVISTNVSGTVTPLPTELGKHGASAVTLAFATGECGSETWAGVSGATMASVNVPLLSKAGVRYVVSTGGAAGVFTCGSDAGFATFVDRWKSPSLVGIDFDIEAGQTESQIRSLLSRIESAHAAYPALTFSLTLATLANNDGATSARSLGSSVQGSFNTYGDTTMAAVKAMLGFTGSPSSWPRFLKINLMTMDYGAPGSGVCVVNGGTCQMGQSAIQAAYNLRDKWGVPFTAMELTPMIGVNDVAGEKVTLADVDAIAAFAVAQSLAGVHYWSYDRDMDCAVGTASPTCNSMGEGYAGPSGYLERFLKNGFR
jgi:chitinase